MLKLPDKTQHQLELVIHSLEREFEGRVPSDAVHRVGQDVLAELLSEARLPDFIPVLTRRYTRERLLREADEALKEAA